MVTRGQWSCADLSENIAWVLDTIYPHGTAAGRTVHATACA